MIRRLRPAGTGAAILCYACLPPATAAADDAPPAQPPPAGVPIASRRRVTLGVLPVTSSIDGRFTPLRGAVETSLEVGLSRLEDVQVVDRSQISKSLDELVLAERNRRDLRLGRLVGAELLLATALVTDAGEVRLELSLVETATGNVLQKEKRRLASTAAGNVAEKHNLSAADHEVQKAVATFTAVLPQLLRERANRPVPVDVAVLPIRFDSDVGPDLKLTESLRRRLADHVAATVPRARVLHRDLAEWVLGEAALAVGAVVDPPKRVEPVAAAVVVEGVLSHAIRPGQPLAESTLRLQLTVHRGDRVLTWNGEHPWKEGDALEREAAVVLAKDVAQLAGAAPPVVAANAIDNRDRKRWESLQYLAEARRHLGAWRDGGRRNDEKVTLLALNLCACAAELTPDDPTPFEIVWRSLMADLPGAAAGGGRAREGTPRDAHPARVLRRQFIDSFPAHPLWPSAVGRELAELVPVSSESPPAPREREAWIALARRFADVVLSGQATLDPTSFTARDRSTIVMDPVSTLGEACRALLAAGDIDRAWELTMAACEQVDAARDEPRGQHLCEGYIVEALRRREFDKAWRAAEYVQANYPGYALPNLLSADASDRTPEDELRSVGLLDLWRPLLEDAHRPSRASWLSVALADLIKLPPPSAARHPAEEAGDRYSPPAAAAGAEKASPPTKILVASAEGLRGNEALRPWCLLLQHQSRRMLLWRAGAQNTVVLDVPTSNLSKQGSSAPPSAVADFDGSPYLLAGGTLYRVNAETGHCDPQTEGLPASVVGGLSDLRIHDRSLYVAGGRSSGLPTAAGFVARLDPATRKWRLWTGPQKAGAVTRLLRSPQEGKLYAFHGSSNLMEVFDPAAADPARSFGEPRKLEQRYEQLGPTATDGACTLRLPSGTATVCRFDPDNPEPAPLYSLRATALGSEHVQFWRPTIIRDGGPAPNPSPAALPLADAPADVAVDPNVPGRFWILDRGGGLTAYEPARDRTAGPFMVAKGGAVLSVSSDALFVNDGAAVVVVRTEKLGRLVADAEIWNTPREAYDALAKRLDNWAKKLPAPERGFYYHSVGRPAEGEAALKGSNAQLPTESAAYRIDRCAAAGRLDLAMEVMKPFLDNPAGIDDPKVEEKILLTLERAARWDMLTKFLPDLWQHSPLRGGQIPAWQRASTHAALIRSLPPKEALAKLTRLRGGELPQVPWSWDENTTYRCVARQIRHLILATPAPTAAR